MDYNKLLAMAKNNADEASHTIKKAKVKAAAGPDPKAVEKFLINKRLNEIRAEEERKQKLERLLELRNQNTKSSKKAKLMACRTKDNDYSKIKLSEREIEVKERIDNELRKKGIGNKLDRMRQRIELEDNEEEQPKIRRKRREGRSHSSHSREDVNYNYSYEKAKKSREEIFKKPDDQQGQARKPPARPGVKPPSFEELMRLAQEKQKSGQKTLEQEIEEELLSKKTKNEKEILKEKEELYMKSLSGRRKNKNTAVPPNRSDCSSGSSVSGQSKRPTDDLQRREEPVRREDRAEYRPEPKKRDLPPISKTYRRESAKDCEPKGSRTSLENILNQSKPGSLASKISSLSKEELEALSEAVKKVTKEKKNPKDEEYSPKACNRYNEYSPNEYRPEEYRPEEYRPARPKAAASKPNNERGPVYVPTKIKNGRQVEEEYDPVTNYKASRAEAPKKPADDGRSKLFDIDSLTPEEIEKIRRERMEKQKRAAEAASSSRPRDRTQPSSSAPSKFKEPARPSHSTLPSQSGRARAETGRPRGAYAARDLPPIGATYRRGDYSASSDYYQNYYGDSDYEDEEDDDMRDFIDDGDDISMRQEDVSKTIHSLFPTRRDRRRDPFSDDDIEEESSYERLMAEEARSARIAREEDEMEERRKREHKKRKEMLRRKGVSVSSDEDDSD